MNYSIPDNLSWRKSSFSGAENCIEMVKLSDGNIAVRDSNAPDDGVLVFTPQEVKAFIQGAKANEFDDI